MRIGDDQQVERRDARRRLRHAGHGIAAVAEDDHRLQLSCWATSPSASVASNQRVDGMPAVFHHLRVGKAVPEPLVVRFPDPAQCRQAPSAGRNRAAACRYRGRGRSRPARCSGRGRCWRRARAPTLPVASNRLQKARTFAVPTVCWVAPMHQMSVEGFSLAKVLGDALQLLAGHAGDALDFGRSPFFDFLADLVHAVDALAMNSLSSQPFSKMWCTACPRSPDVGAGADAHEFVGMRRGAGEARVDDDEVLVLSSLPESSAAATPGAPRPDCRP
jgi:hypothetical protein